MLKLVPAPYRTDILNQRERKEKEKKRSKEESFIIANRLFNNIQDHLLPRSLTIRLAKSVLPPNTTIQKDAVLAIQKAATVFVSYLSSQCVSLILPGPLSFL